MTFRPNNTQERILHRLKIAQGHLKKVIKMVEGGDYCIDILTQSQAVQHAIKKTNDLILENHLKTCVISNIKSGQTETTIAEMMKVFSKS